MLCEACKTNEARVFLTQIVDGKMSQMKLCEACAQEKGLMNGAALAALRKARGGQDGEGGEAPQP